MDTTTNGVAKGSEKTKRKSAILKIEVDKLDAASLAAACDRYGIDHGGFTNEQMAIALVTHFEAIKTTGVELLECQECNGWSPDELDACPFCGVGEEEEVEEEAPRASAKAAPPPAEPKEAAPPAAEKAAKKADKERIQKEPPKPAPPLPKASAALTPIKKTKAPPVVDDTVPSSEILTEKTLDEHVSAIRAARADSAVGYWKVGEELRRIEAPQLWKLRKGEDGKPLYRTSQQFWMQELGMTPQQGNQAIKLATTYSEQQVRAFGSSKLVLALQVSEDDLRKEVEEKIKAGATHREVAERVREINAEKREKAGGALPVKTRSGKEIKQTGGRQKAAKPKVTAVLLEGSYSVKLFKKPASIKGVDVDALPRAKRIADVPFGRVILENNTVCYVVLAESEKGLVAKLTFKRGGDDAE